MEVCGLTKDFEAPGEGTTPLLWKKGLVMPSPGDVEGLQKTAGVKGNGQSSPEELLYHLLTWPPWSPSAWPGGVGAECLL